MLVKSLGIALVALVLIVCVMVYISFRTRQSPVNETVNKSSLIEGEQSVDHAVIVHLMYEPLNNGFPADGGLVDKMHALQDKLIQAIDDAGVGELDGDEFGQGECVIFMYGPDADALWKAIEPVVRGSDFGEGSFVYKRYGDVNDEDALVAKEPL